VSSTDQVTSVCNDTPDSNGTPWGCCTDGDNACICTANPVAAFCATGTRVHDCTDKKALGIANPVTSCPSGTTSISSCSKNLTGTCQSASECPGDDNCTFAGDVAGCCTPVCGTDHRCGLDCFTTST
jgi:hypothetical protein